MGYGINGVRFLMIMVAVPPQLSAVNCAEEMPHARPQLTRARWRKMPDENFSSPSSLRRRLPHSTPNPPNTMQSLLLHSRSTISGSVSLSTFFLSARDIAVEHKQPPHVLVLQSVSSLLPTVTRSTSMPDKGILDK